MSNEMWVALGKVGERDLKEEKRELEWLRYFYENADFGPAHEDVVDMIKQAYVDSGGRIPEGY